MPQQYFQSWDIQETKIRAEILSAMRSGARKFVIVVSEVFYATGLRIPICDFVNRLKSKLADLTFHVIVDGTNAVGNRGLVNLDGSWDFYVFSPHKWLMASEGCGILISRRFGLSAPYPPGLWQTGERKADAQVRVLAGLRGALELIKTQGIGYFAARCEKLRQELKLNLPKGLRLVGDQSSLEQTFILSCCPISGSSWKFTANELEAAFESRALRASVLRLDAICPWVRVTVPYYLDVRELDRLSSFLEGVTQ